MSLSHQNFSLRHAGREFGVANFRLKSRRKTSAYEIRTFQCGTGNV